MNIVEFTEYLIQSICKEKDLVKVTSLEEEGKLTLEVFVPESSMGSVMGREGRNIKAVRTLVNAYAYLHELPHVELNIESF